MGKRDTAWFKARREELGLSQAQVADRLGQRHKSAVSRFETGKANFDDMEMFTKLAVILDQPLEEVLFRAGWELPPEPGRQIRVTEYADAKGEVKHIGRTNQRRVERPGTSQPPDLAAIEMRAPGAPCDGWVLFYSPTSRIAPEAIGRLSVVHGADGGKRVGIVRQGSRRGLWSIESLCAPGAVARDGAIDSAAPVLLIQP